jgi:hypothetical protein
MRTLQSLLLIVLLSLRIPVAGQDLSSGEEQDRPLRVEIGVKSDNETYRIVPCGKDHALMFYKSTESADAKVNWYFTLFDRNFRKQWVKSIPLDKDMGYQSDAFCHDTVILVFRDAGKSKNANDFMIVRVLLSKGSFIMNSGTLPDNCYSVKYILSPSSATIAFNTKEGPAQVLMLNLVTGTRNTSAPVDMVSAILAVQADSVTGRFLAVLLRQPPKKNPGYVYVEFDTTGHAVAEIPIDLRSEDVLLQDIEILKEADGSVTLFGTFDSGGLQKTTSKKKPGESTGFFFCNIAGNQHKPVVYTNFLDLKCIRDVVNEKDMQALQKKAAKNNKNLNEYSLDLHILSHPVKILDGKYCVAAEVYTPQYHTENYTDFDFYGRPFTNSYTVFDGYRYTNMIVAAFSREGSVLWDNSMEIRNLISFELMPRVNLYFTGNNIVLAYVSEGKIATKIIHEGNVIEKLDFSPSDMMYSNDKLLSETRSRMVHWYDNYFLCYGYDEIKNVALSSNNKRLVYFFSKVKFE